MSNVILVTICQVGILFIYKYVQRRQVTCLKPHSHSSNGAGFEPGSCASLSLPSSFKKPILLRLNRKIEIAASNKY